MEPTPASIPLQENGRIRPLRAVLAFLVSLFLVVGSLAYHDGAFAVDDLADADSEGSYRFKGRIESVDADGQGFTLADSSESRRLHWNVTRPSVGSIVVVEAEIVGSGGLVALALSDALVFRDL